MGGDWFVSILANAVVDWRISNIAVQTRNRSLGRPLWHLNIGYGVVLIVEVKDQTT